MVSLFCITCSLENNAFSVLYYVIKVTLRYQGAYSLRSKRFRLVLEQKRPWKGIFGFDRARNEPKNERGGRGREGRIRCVRTGNKRVICPATLLQNKLNSDVARFTTHGQTC